MLLASPSCVWCSPFCLCGGPVEWRGGCVCCVVPLVSCCPRSLHGVPCLCVRCHSIVGLVPCLCDRVVSFWNSGDGLCWVEGRVVPAVHCQLFVCCVLCVVCCGMAVGERVCGLVACPLSSSSSSSSFCVGVRGSARAAMRARTLSPNTIASPLLCSLLVFSSLLFSPPFFTIRLSCCCGMAVCDSPCVGVPSWHDCYG